MSTATAPRAIAVSESLLRREAVENAVADLRLEGLAPTADARLLFEQFVQGDLTEEQLVNATQGVAVRGDQRYPRVKSDPELRHQEVACEPLVGGWVNDN